MAETAAPESEDDVPQKGGKKGLIIALAGALAAGGGSFFATYSGLLDGLVGAESAEKKPMMAATDYTFVPLESLIVSLGPRASSRTLKFTAQLEVVSGAQDQVEMLKPRILDVLNEYLRAVEEIELESPGSLTLLRAQMLRRIAIVVGDGLVRDLLILEFVLS